MKIKSYIFLVFIVSLFLLSGCKKSDDVMEKKDNAIMEKNESTQNPDYFMAKGKVLAGTKTPFIDFNKEDYNKALSENKVILLYFYANWCPICKFEEPNTRAAFNELNNENAVGFRVNYKDSDTDKDEEALAEEFQVPYQHTKVIIKDGKQVLKSPDTWGKERYINEINKYA